MKKYWVLFVFIMASLGMAQSVYEIAVRQVDPAQLEAFVVARANFIPLVKANPNSLVDREFESFMALPDPDPSPVFVGMTEWASVDAYAAAGQELFATDDDGTLLVPEVMPFVSTIEAFKASAAIAPIEGPEFDLATLAENEGEVLELAVRRIKAGMEDEFQASRRAYIDLLNAEEGVQASWEFEVVFAEDMQGLTVGMSVYDSQEALQGVLERLSETPEAQRYFGTFDPVAIQYAVSTTSELEPAMKSLGLDSDSKMITDSVRQIAIADDAFYPESVAVHDGHAYVSAFFTGEIQKVNIQTGEAETLVAAGTDGVVAGWGLWYDDVTDVLLACANRNVVPGPQDTNNAARAIDPVTGEILTTWELPAGTACNSIFTDVNADVYLSDVSPNASIVKIDRASGMASSWIDEPSWENDTGFGVGGLVWDGGSNLYASINGLQRIPINADGSAGTPVAQTFVDAEGNELPPFSFDGFVYAGDNTMYGAAFDFEAFQPQVVELTVIDSDTVQAEVIYTDAVGITGIDAEDGNVYAADGQIIQALFIEDYSPAPFNIHVIQLGDTMSGADKTGHHEGMMVTPAAMTSTLESGATMMVYDFGSAKIHAYTGGPAANGTYIIEGENSLVLVDAQFLAPVAQEFRAYADSLGKPIERIIITHEHVDHWFGLGAAFTDVNVYATPGTQAFINETGAEQVAARAESMGASTTFVSIGNSLPQGGEVIDGLRYNYFVYQDAEAEEQVVIHLPELGAVLVGDLIYNNFYLILEPGFDAWLNILESLKSLDAGLILPGHGAPADASILDNNIDYLETAKDIYATASGPEDFQAQMTANYPNLQGAFFWDLIVGRLYGQQ